MSERLKLEEFDILGIIELQDVQGIEKYVTPIQDGDKIVGYLSRSKEYYNVKTMTELAFEREELRTRLTEELTKWNFVILENMLNCSAKVYFKKFEQYILNGKSLRYKSQVEQARVCLMEDMTNILHILQGKGKINCETTAMLPVGVENSVKRAIEMDNKALLYTYAQALKMNKPENIEVLTPGYGSLYIGPMLKAMYGCDYTNMLKSKYIEETIPGDAKEPLRALVSSDRVFENGKTIFLLDDNIGTGQTMNEIKDELQKNGIRDVLSGAIQYNWRNYYRVSTGEKKDIERFRVEDFDFLSPFNYAGHKLYKHAIDALHSSGKEYISYLNSKSYRIKEYSDIKGAIKRAIICANSSGLTLSDEYSFPEFDSKIAEAQEILPEYKNGVKKVENPIARKIINDLIGRVMFSRGDEEQNNGEPR